MSRAGHGRIPARAEGTPMAGAAEPAIRVSGLEKRFGRLRVLKGLDLEIATGRVTAILGPNGSGKTTLIKCVLGLVRPDEGEIRVAGEPANGDGAYRRRIGYMPQIPRYPENLTVREILAMIEDLRGQTGASDPELLDAFGLSTELDKAFKTLSGGNRQRVSATLAFAFRPDILLLDEPTAGLDPVASSALKDRIRREREAGTAVVLTSHVLAEVEQLADRVIYLLEGRVHFDDSVESLLHRTEETSLERAIARVIRDWKGEMAA